VHVCVDSSDCTRVGAAFVQFCQQDHRVGLCSINALRNLLNQTSFSTQKKPSFKNGTSQKACTRPKTQTTKQQGEMCNINQVRCEWRDFLFWNTKESEKSLVEEEESKEVGGKKAT